MHSWRITSLEHPLSCVNVIGKHNGLVHLLYAMLVHAFLCKYMKRSVVMVKLWITFRMQINETWFGNA